MFYLHCSILIFTLLAIYICLKWYNLPSVSKKEAFCDNPPAHKQWVRRQNTIRFFILLITCLANVVGYYVLDYNGSAYLAIMSLLCIPFTLSKREK